VVKNAVSGLNVVPDVPMVTFPIETFDALIEKAARDLT
jgi:hypothetical protein